MAGVSSSELDALIEETAASLGYQSSDIGQKIKLINYPSIKIFKIWPLNNLKFGESLTSISHSKAEIEIFKHKGVLIFAYLSF